VGTLSCGFGERVGWIGMLKSTTHPQAVMPPAESADPATVVTCKDVSPRWGT